MNLVAVFIVSRFYQITFCKLLIELTAPSGNPINRFTFPVGSGGGNAIFSLFPFPNNPGGVYGENTFTQQLPASARGKILSGKFDGNFKTGERQQSFTARYNFTDDWREIPATGGALFSTLRPRVRTQNLSLFLNSEVTTPNAARPVFNQVRLSYGRTRLNFEEVRDREFLLPSGFSDPVFGSFGLLNAPLLENFTSPGAVGTGANTQLIPNTGDVFYLAGRCNPFNIPRPCTTEDQLGPVGQINVAGFSPIGIDVFNFPQRRVNNTYQAADNLTLRFNNHYYTFGVDTRRSELNSDLPRNARSLITFIGVLPMQSSLPVTIPVNTSAFNLPSGIIRPEDLVAASAPSGHFLIVAAPGNSRINLRFYQLNFFAQDEWRVRPQLSLTYGLRYEYNTVPRETSQRIERTFSSPDVSLVPGLRDFLEGRTRIFDPDRNNFAPRVGVAYSTNLLGQRGATVFRAGYGLFYDQILGSVVSQSRNVFPLNLTLNLAGSPSSDFGRFTQVLRIINPSIIGLLQPGTVNTPDPTLSLAQQIDIINRVSGISRIGSNLSVAESTLSARRLKTPLAHQYSFTIDQQLGRDLVISLAYTGTQGRNLLRLTTPNLGPNTSVVLQSAAAILSQIINDPLYFGTVVPPGARLTAAGNFTGGRPNGGVGTIYRIETTANSRYDALQVELQGRSGGALQYQAAYTYSKALDDVSDFFDLAGASALPQNSFNLAAERGPANFDVRHRFAYNFIYDLPTPTNSGKLLRLMLGGVQLAGTGQLQTGQPFTVNSIFDVNLDGNLTDRLNTREGIVQTGDRRQPVQLTTDDPTLLLAPLGQDGSVGRNTFRAGSILELNMAVIKRFAFTEQQNLQLRIDAFNITNRANFGIPVRLLEAPGFGKATETVTPGRRIQFALKYSF